jgi:hypothetical protein
MSRSRVFVEIDVDGNPIRIFKNSRNAYALPDEKRRELPRAYAIGLIRHAIFIRSAGKCEYGCGRTFPENGPLKIRMHMHEEKPKSAGGEVSLDNGRGVCYYCHFGDARGHLARRLHFGEVTGGLKTNDRRGINCG